MPFAYTLLLLVVAALVAPKVELESKDHLLDFSYGWSAEAAAVPALHRRFRADAAKQKRDMLTMARGERSVRLRMNELEAWGGLAFTREWETSGRSVRLLSLTGSTSAFTGGAHPNNGTTALLWDRKLNREISLRGLLRPGQSWNGAIRLPFCILLDRERQKRRQQVIKRGEWPNQCPEVKELTMVVADHDRNGRFDHVAVTADSYVAGPYVEGAYEISLPLTAAMLARVQPAYAASFEPRPAVR